MIAAASLVAVFPSGAGDADDDGWSSSRPSCGDGEKLALGLVDAHGGAGGGQRARRWQRDRAPGERVADVVVAVARISIATKDPPGDRRLSMSTDETTTCALDAPPRSGDSELAGGQASIPARSSCAATTRSSNGTDPWRPSARLEALPAIRPHRRG